MEGLFVYHRVQIRDFFGFCEGTEKDIQDMKKWLIRKVAAYNMEITPLKDIVYAEYPRHVPEVRYTLLFALFWSRCQEITDSLVELFIT